MTIGSLSENVPPYTEAEAIALIGLAMAGKPQTFEWRCKKKDGTVFWVEIGRRSTAFGLRNYLLSTCPSSNGLGQSELFRDGGSGSFGFEIRRLSTDVSIVAV